MLSFTSDRLGGKANSQVDQRVYSARRQWKADDGYVKGRMVVPLLPHQTLVPCVPRHKQGGEGVEGGDEWSGFVVAGVVRKDIVVSGRLDW